MYSDFLHRLEASNQRMKAALEDWDREIQRTKDIVVILQNIGASFEKPEPEVREVVQPMGE